MTPNAVPMSATGFFVPGPAVPQGATTSFMPKGGKRPITKYTNQSRLAAWRADVREAAERAGVQKFDHEVVLSITVYVRRPKTHFGTGSNNWKLKDSAPAFPTSRNSGDADKLARAIMDALAGIAYDDDAQVADLLVAKRWVDAGGRGEGAAISVVGA